MEESDSRLRLLDGVQSKASALTRILNTSSVSLNDVDFSSAPKMPVCQKPKRYSQVMSGCDLPSLTTGPEKLCGAHSWASQ